MKKSAESVQSGLWGYETSSGNIPLFSYTEKTKTFFDAVNFTALYTGLRSKCNTV